MPTCEKCWADAHKRAVSNPTRSQTDHYYDLLKERKDKPCSPEEQAGDWRQDFQDPHMYEGEERYRCLTGTLVVTTQGVYLYWRDND
jgi:hypothetical protein